MNKPINTNMNDINDIADATGTLLADSTDMAGQKICDARKRLAAGVDQVRNAYDNARDKAYQTARAADQAVREHPYQAIAIGIGIGAGALFGYLLAHRCTCQKN